MNKAPRPVMLAAAFIATLAATAGLAAPANALGLDDPTSPPTPQATALTPTPSPSPTQDTTSAAPVVPTPAAPAPAAPAPAAPAPAAPQQAANSTLVPLTSSSVSVTSSDGGARLTGSITWHSTSYSAYFTLSDIKADGKGPDATIVSSYGWNWVHSDDTEHNGLGNGSGIGFPVSWSSSPYANENVNITVCNAGGSCTTKLYDNPLN